MKRVTVVSFCTLLGAGVLVSSTHARADAVPSPPTDCPRGSIGRTSHSGTWCDPTTCATSDACEESRLCEPQGLCVRSETYMRGGMRAADQPDTPLSRQVAAAACSAGDACADGSRCVVAQRCVTPSLADAFNPRNAGCGCALARPTDATMGRFATLAALLLLAAARRKSGR